MKQGFGFALGVTLFVLVLLLVTGTALGIATGSITWPFASQAMRYEGVGPSDSAPFHLDGTYDATWTATPVGGEPCLFRAYVVVPGTTAYAAQVADLPIDATSPGTATRQMAVLSGDYALHVDSGCSWSIRIVRR